MFSAVSSASSVPYDPPVAKPAKQTTDHVPDDVNSVLAHITSQIKNKEQSKKSMY